MAEGGGWFVRAAGIFFVGKTNLLVEKCIPMVAFLESLIGILHHL
jgi:hypothetical protein